MAVVLKFQKETKHTVVYSLPPGSFDPATTPSNSVYFSKEWLKAQGWPKGAGFNQEWPAAIEHDARIPA